MIFENNKQQLGQTRTSLSQRLTARSSGGSRISPRWVRQPSSGGGANIRFCYIFSKTACNWKNFDPRPGGGASLEPSLDPQLRSGGSSISQKGAPTPVGVPQPIVLQKFRPRGGSRFCRYPLDPPLVRLPIWLTLVNKFGSGSKFWQVFTCAGGST